MSQGASTLDWDWCEYRLRSLVKNTDAQYMLSPFQIKSRQQLLPEHMNTGDIQENVRTVLFHISC